MRSLWRSIEVDSRAVEVSTGVVCSAIALTIVISRGELLPWPPAAALWLLVALLHIVAALRGTHSTRQGFAGATAITFVLLALYNGDATGWLRPGVAALAAGALVQCWVWLAIESDRVDADRRRKHVH